MALELITPPDFPVVTLPEAKAHLRVEHTDDDDFIQTLIDAATGALDGQYGRLGRALNPQTWDLVLTKFPGCGCLKIPLPPLISIDSVPYLVGGVETIIDPSAYEVDTVSVPGRLLPVANTQWPTPDSVTNAVRIRFTAGWPLDYPATGVSGEVVSTVPPPIKAAIKIMVADMYENRESVTSNPSNPVNIPLTAELLIHPYKVMVLA